MARQDREQASLWRTVHVYCAVWFTDWHLSAETPAEIMDVIDI